MLSTLQAHLSEHVGRSDLRLFEAICARAPSDLDANQTTLHLNKAQVLAALRKIEGKDVSPKVVRSRIRHLNAALIAIGRDVYRIKEAIMTISSRKDSIVLELLPVMVRCWADCKDDRVGRFLSISSMRARVLKFISRVFTFMLKVQLFLSLF